MMRITLSVLTAIAALIATAPAFAGNKAACGNAPRDQWLSEDAVKASLAAQNYDVRRIKIDDGCYEADAIDKAGTWVEIDVNPVTGAIVEIEVDD